jgi:hypothetical protein
MAIEARSRAAIFRIRPMAAPIIAHRSLPAGSIVQISLAGMNIDPGVRTDDKHFQL